MSKYSTLDAHSRNCSACIKQRESSCSEVEWRKPSHSHHHDKKKTSLQLQTERRKSSSVLRRSNSCLSSSSMTGSLREDGSEGTSYLTPTQRKNMEIKNIRLELERAKVQLDEKDREILILRKEVAALKEAQTAANCPSWTAETETESVGDSGNCEELAETEEENVTSVVESSMDNFEFELMESALKEEEEHRHQLESDNQELTSQVAGLQQELLEIRQKHQDEILSLRKCHSEDVIDAKKESNQKVEELIIELAGSSMRCARQQDAIEQKQLRIDELLQEVGDNKERIARLAETTNTKDKDPEYLIPKQRVSNISSQTELHSLNHSATQTEHSVDTTGSMGGAFENMPDYNKETLANLPDLSDSNKKEESNSNNNIHYTYQFLRRSIYYYITEKDKENRAYHLRSIQRLLEFSDAELNLTNKGPVSHKRY